MQSHPTSRLAGAVRGEDEKSKGTQPLQGVRPLRPQRAHLAIEQSSTAVLPHQQRGCLPRTDSLNFKTSFPDYKAPLRFLLELLAIPNGWRHKLQAKKRLPHESFSTFLCPTLEGFSLAFVEAVK